MKVVKSEKIYLSETEMKSFALVSECVEGLIRVCEHPTNKEVARNLELALIQFWQRVEDNVDAI